MITPFLISLIYLFSFISSQTKATFEDIGIDYEDYLLVSKNLKFNYNSTLPFSIHITFAVGNIKPAVYADANKDIRLPLLVKTHEKKLILTEPNPTLNSYYVVITCVSCAYFVQFRQDNFTGAIQLNHRVSNYEYIYPNNVTQFSLPKTVNSNFPIQSDVYITSLNCDFFINTHEGETYSDKNYFKFKYTQTVFGGNDPFVSFNMGVSKMYNEYDVECQIFFDITYYDKTYLDVYMEIPARSTHTFYLDESNFPFRFITAVCVTGRYVFPYFDFMNEGLFEYGCEEKFYGTQITTSGTTQTLLTTRSIAYGCTIKPLTNDFHFYNITLLMREGSVDYPGYFAISQYRRDFLSFRMHRYFYTLIHDFVGRLVVYNPRAKAKNCIRIREFDEVDEGAYFMININVDLVCIKGHAVEESYNEITTMIIPENETRKCKENGCELYYTIEVNVRGPSDEGTTGKKTYQRGYYEDFLFYIQKPGEITKAYFNEPIFGEFISENDIEPMYYQITVPFQILSILINFERYKDNVILYIKRGNTKPTQQDYDWKMEKSIETSIMIHYTPKEGDDEFGTFQEEIFTLMLLPTRYEKHKSSFKVRFTPQYPFSPVQTAHVKLGDSNLCNVDDPDNLYCVFTLFLNERISLQGWSFYIEFPYDHTLQADSIYIRTLPYNLVWANTFTYLDNNIERLFPNDNTSYTIKLDKGEHAYYFNDDSMDELKLVLVKVNVPRPAKVKMHSTRYYNRTAVNTTYFLSHQYYYTTSEIDSTMKVQLEEGMITEWKKVFPQTGKIDATYSIDPIYEDDNCVRFTNDNSETTILDIYLNKEDNGVGYLLSTYEGKEVQPEFMEFKGINNLRFENGVNSKYIINLLPKGKNINVHLYLQAIESKSVQRSSSLSNTPCGLFNMKAYILDIEDYDMIMENRLSIPKSEIDITCNEQDNYAFLHFNSPSTDLNYFYLITERKSLEQTTPFTLLVMKQEDNESPDYYVSQNQPIHGIVSKNKTLSEMNLPVLMTYIINTPQSQQFTIQIKTTNTNNIQNYLNYYNISTHSISTSGTNESWYIQYRETSSGVMKLNIIEEHPQYMDITLGFMFKELDEVEYEMRIIPIVQSTTDYYSYLVPAGVFVVCLIVFLVVLTVLRQRKKKIFTERFTDMNKSPFGIDKDSPGAQEEDILKDMLVIEKPKEDDIDLNQWGT